MIPTHRSTHRRVAGLAATSALLLASTALAACGADTGSTVGAMSTDGAAAATPTSSRVTSTSTRTTSTSTRTSSTSTRPTSSSRTPSAPASGSTSMSGVATCDISTLPSQVRTTVTAIHHGGPFVRSKDGSTYRNSNGFLPTEPNGFYREYTVKTPGTSTAGARRVVTGGNPKLDPPWLFYTGNHYDTFCQIVGA